MDTDKIKYGCGGVALAIFAGFGLMMWWYSRPESPEARDQRLLDTVRTAITQASNDFEEATALLARQDYSTAYSKAMYDAFNPRYLTDISPDSREYAPGMTAKAWLDGKKTLWRQKVNEEFDRQAAQFSRCPIEAADRMETLAGQYREYSELKSKLDMRRKDIDSARAKEASVTLYVYMPFHDFGAESGYMETAPGLLTSDKKEKSLEWRSLDTVSNALASAWVVTPGVKLRFIETPWPDRNIAGTWEYIAAQIDIPRDSYVTRKGQSVSTRIASGIGVRFERSGGQRRSSWSTLPTLTAVLPPPEVIQDSEYSVARQHEKKLLDEFRRNLAGIPAFKPSPDAPVK